MLKHPRCPNAIPYHCDRMYLKQFYHTLQRTSTISLRSPSSWIGALQVSPKQLLGLTRGSLLLSECSRYGSGVGRRCSPSVHYMKKTVTGNVSPPLFISSPLTALGTSTLSLSLHLHKQLSCSQLSRIVLSTVRTARRSIPPPVELGPPLFLLFSLPSPR